MSLTLREHEPISVNRDRFTMQSIFRRSFIYLLCSAWSSSCPILKLSTSVSVLTIAPLIPSTASRQLNRERFVLTRWRWRDEDSHSSGVLRKAGWIPPVLKKSTVVKEDNVLLEFEQHINTQRSLRSYRDAKSSLLVIKMKGRCSSTVRIEQRLTFSDSTHSPLNISKKALQLVKLIYLVLLHIFKARGETSTPAHLWLFPN